MFSIGEKRIRIQGKKISTTADISEQRSEFYYIPSSKSYCPYIDCLNELFKMYDVPTMHYQKLQYTKGINTAVAEHLNSLNSTFVPPISYVVWMDGRHVRKMAPSCERKNGKPYYIILVSIPEEDGGGIHPILIKHEKLPLAKLFKK